MRCFLGCGICTNVGLFSINGDLCFESFPNLGHPSVTGFVCTTPNTLFCHVCRLGSNRRPLPPTTRRVHYLSFLAGRVLCFSPFPCLFSVFPHPVVLLHDLHSFLDKINNEICFIITNEMQIKFIDVDALNRSIATVAITTTTTTTTTATAALGIDGNVIHQTQCSAQQ
jgi:hypothetical protein